MTFLIKGISDALKSETVLKSEGLSPDRAAKALTAAGYLVPDGNRPQRKVSLPDNTRPRMYCVKGSILDD